MHLENQQNNNNKVRILMMKKINKISMNYLIIYYLKNWVSMFILKMYFSILNFNSFKFFKKCLLNHNLKEFLFRKSLKLNLCKIFTKLSPELKKKYSINYSRIFNRFYQTKIIIVLMHNNIWI